MSSGQEITGAAVSDEVRKQKHMKEHIVLKVDVHVHSYIHILFLRV